MEPEVLTGYLERIYGYAVRSTFSRDEADELSQEILLTLIRALPALRDPKKLEPWLWGLAANVTKAFRRQQGRRRAMYSYDALAELPQPQEEDETALYGWVRARVASLSALYRETMVLRYFDGLSCKEIAERLSIPEGTVEWRLAQGRKKLKKECVKMTETTLRPVNMTIRINGGGNYNGRDIPFPWVFVEDALSKNILYYCYEEPRTVEALSGLSGVPAYFIEDTVGRLLQREALCEPVRGKYRTAFLVYDKRHSDCAAQATASSGDLAEAFVPCLQSLTQAVLQTGIDTAGQEESGLLHLFGLMALEHLGKRENPFPPVTYPLRYDGCRWVYHAHMKGGYQGGGLGLERNLNLEGGGYTHTAYHFGGFGYRPCLSAGEIGVCEAVLEGEALDAAGRERAADLAEKGILKIEAGKGRVLIPSFTREKIQEFYKLAEARLAPVLPLYRERLERYAARYRRLFPKHLETDVNRSLHGLYLNFFVHVAAAAQEKGLLKKPAETAFCDVLIQRACISDRTGGSFI